jgi:hypothetical protein
MRMITPTEVRPHHIDGSPHRFYAFANGKFQVGDEIGGIESYGARDGLYEMATLTPNGDTVDVVGYLDEEQVQRELERREDEPAGMLHEY